MQFESLFRKLKGLHFHIIALSIIHKITSKDNIFCKFCRIYRGIVNYAIKQFPASFRGNIDDYLLFIIQKHKLPVAIIDHHIQSDDMGTAIVSDQNASSTGELIYDFLNRNNCQWNQLIVNALYTCILTDTGSFRCLELDS